MLLKFKNRELVHLCIVLIIAITSSMFSISFSLIDRTYNFFESFTTLPVAEFLINVGFLTLTGLLWLTYCRWREASTKSAELANIIDSISPDVLIVVDPSRNIMMCNRSVERMYGYSVDEVINQKTDILYFDRRSDSKKRHEIFETLKGEGFHIGLAMGRKKNGETMPLEIIAGRLSSGKGAVLLLRDITERKGAEEELLRITKAVESASDAIGMSDPQGHHFYQNRAFTDLFEYTAEELEAAGGGPAAYVDPAIAREVFTEIMNGKSWIGETEMVSKSGRKFPAFLRADAIKDDAGNIIGLIGIHTDISDQKQAEAALVQAKEDWENTFDAITDMVMLLDTEHQVLRVNKAAAEALHATKESLVGRKCYEAIHGQSHPIRKCPLVLTMKTLEPHTAEITEPNLGGTFICSTSPIVDSAGSLSGYTHTLKDITKSKRLEAQFQQAQKLESIGTLAGGIAHDFNNLLMGIQGNISLMFMEMDSTHLYYERLKNIEKQVNSGARLTSHLLGYARKGKYEVNPFDLNQMLKEASEAFGRTRKEIAIHRELADDLCAIEADSGQLEQMLLNLFLNASDAMPGGGDLVLKTMNVTHKDMTGKLYNPKPGNYVQLTVTDTGGGMDKETMERIFDPFFTTKEMGRGTGLGLASAYGIIKGHGGYIDVASKKGQGATFSIYLPASERKVQKAVKTAELFIKGSGMVLLVDDEEIILEVGKELLEGMGYRVLTAKDGKEAVEVYKKDRDEIDIVVLDMVMPNMGGGEAYDRMKEINPDIKVLLSSGFSIDGEATEILERGCNGFIQKPFNMEELSAKTREILNKE